MSGQTNPGTRVDSMERYWTIGMELCRLPFKKFGPLLSSFIQYISVSTENSKISRYSYFILKEGTALETILSAVLLSGLGTCLLHNAQFYNGAV